MVWYEKFYTYITYLLYILFFISFFQIKNNAPEYLDDLNIIIKVFICLFLLYRFNPFTNNTFNEFDKKIVFDCALYLLFSSLFIDLYLIFQKRISSKITTNIIIEDEIKDKNNKNK